MLLPFLAFLLLPFTPPGAAQRQLSKPQSPTSQPQVVKVENGGLLFTDNQAGVTGTDAGYSIPMANQSLWLFGDVFLQDPSSPTVKSLGAVSNCALLTPLGTGTSALHNYSFLTDMRTGAARQVLPLLPGESRELRFWPFGGWYSPADRRVYLFYGRVRVTGGGAFDFRTEGHGLATADAENPTKLEFKRVLGHAEAQLWWPATSGGSVFGSAVVSEPASKWLYVIGVQERAGRKVGKIARVPRAKISDLEAYTYYSGSLPTPAWSKNSADAADVEGLTDFPSELSVAWNPYLGGYLAVHSIGISDRARLSLARYPWGPYTQIAEIATPHKAFAKAFCYAAKEHPELRQDQGRVIYMTYVDSDRYWLHLLKITLKR